MPGEIADDLAGQSVLVTGGAGFIGSHLAAALTDQIGRASCRERV